jgi:hypothetical protein
VAILTISLVVLFLFLINILLLMNKACLKYFSSFSWISRNIKS